MVQLDKKKCDLCGTYYLYSYHFDPGDVNMSPETELSLARMTPLQALQYFEMAKEAAVDEELAAKATFYAAMCHQNRYFYYQIDQKIKQDPSLLQLTAPSVVIEEVTKPAPTLNSLRSVHTKIEDKPAEVQAETQDEDDE